MRPSSLDLFKFFRSFELSLGRFAIVFVYNLMSRFCFLGLYSVFNVLALRADALKTEQSFFQCASSRMIP